MCLAIYRHPQRQSIIINSQSHPKDQDGRLYVFDDFKFLHKLRWKRIRLDHKLLHNSSRPTVAQ